MDALTTATAVDPRRYFESASARRSEAAAKPGLPLSRDHQPLQSALHHLPAHL